jgi:hypothetical protein
VLCGGEAGWKYAPPTNSSLRSVMKVLPPLICPNLPFPMPGIELLAMNGRSSVDATPERKR